VDRHTLFPGVAIHAIGGEQVMICHVEYAPGTRVRGTRIPTAEQVMWIVDGDVTMTVGDETKTLGAGDVVVVNRGVEHELYSEGGMTFVEALAPVLATTCPTRGATSCSAAGRLPARRELGAAAAPRGLGPISRVRGPA
jgi:quercetin dioxygenase-like cupin family protein